MPGAGGDPVIALREPLTSAWRALCLGAVVLVALGPLTRALDHLGDRDFDDPLEDWARLFDLQSEANLPTLYATVLLLTVAATFVVRSVIGPAMEALAWRCLAVAAGLLAVDEATTLHERFLGPVGRSLGGGSGFLRFAWVIPGTVLAAVALVVLARVARRLPAGVRRGLLLAVALFLGGAIGLEAVSGMVESSRGRGRIFLAVATLEEAFEFAGALLALRTALGGLVVVRSPGELRIALWRPGEAPTTSAP